MSILVVGAGGHAKVVIATLQAAGHEVAGLLDDDPDAAGREVLGAPVIGPVGHLGAHRGPAILAIGSNQVRQRLAEAYSETEWATVIHPRAVVHASARLGEGSVVFAGAVVQPEVHIGRHAVVNTSASVDHDCYLGDFVHLAPGVHLSGNVRMDEGSFLGVGACAAPSVRIGAWGTVGAGAVVVRDLPRHTTSVGVPARPLRRT